MIKVESLDFSYGERLILRDVSFSFGQGEIITLMGKSGSGKTTLLKVLGGLLTPDKGHYWFNDMDVYRLSDANRKISCTQKMGFVWQNYRLVSELTVEKNILLPSYINKEAVDQSYLEELANLLGIAEYLNQYPNRLSGGEQQRVSLARALLLKPKLVLADEPTGALDSKTSENLIALIQKVNEIYQTLFVIATHNEELSKIGSSHIKLEDGHVVKR